MISKKDVQNIFEIFENKNQDPQTELIYSTPFSLLVAVVLSAQATDRSVNKVIEPILAKIDTPQKIVNLGKENFAQMIKSINIYRNKAHYIFETAKILISQYQSQVPLQFDQLIKLPGVGQKTANVILNVLTNSNKIAVDTHVFRVSRRLELSQASNVYDLEEDLYKIVPKKFWSRTNHWLVLHGRYVCKARKPLCLECCLNKSCEYFKNIK